MRHAYGLADRFLIGLTWSTFSDVRSLPNTVDLDGPNSSFAERTVQIRYQKEIQSYAVYAFAVESPRPDIYAPDSIGIESAFQSFPDVSARFRMFDDWGHFQFAGILRSINVKDIEGNLSYEFGYGFLFSGELKLEQSNQILFQTYFGSAISRFVTGIFNRMMRLAAVGIYQVIFFGIPRLEPGLDSSIHLEEDKTRMDKPATQTVYPLFSTMISKFYFE